MAFTFGKLQLRLGVRRNEIVNASIPEAFAVKLRWLHLLFHSTLSGVLFHALYIFVPELTFLSIAP